MTKNGNSVSHPSLIGRADLPVIVILLLLSAVILGIRAGATKDSLVAQVSIDGKEYTSIDLLDPANEQLLIVLPTQPQLSILVQGNTVRCTDSHCADHTCEHSGVLSKAGDTAVCLPARVIVKLVSSEKASTPDGVAS